MNLQSILSTNVKNHEAGQEAITIQQLPFYIVCIVLGILAGAMGVALAIGVAIIVQLMISPAVVFSPGIVPLALGAAGAGVLISWLLYLTVGSVRPNLFSKGGLQVMMVSGVFTSLLQIVLFMVGL